MGTDIFRMKGILDVKGRDERFVFQGVHMLFDGRPDRPWRATEPRGNQLVFIGRNLDRDRLGRRVSIVPRLVRPRSNSSIAGDRDVSIG